MNTEFLVFDVLGKEVVRSASAFSDGISLAALRKGTYYVKIMTGEGMTTRKIVKQ